MKINNKKELMQLIFFTICIIFAFIYIEYIWQFITYIVKLFMPFIIGVCIAFVLNVLMNVVEKKWLKKCKLSDKAKRTISLIISIGLILLFLVLILFLIIPNLQDAVVIFADNLPSYSNSIKELLEEFNVSSDVINDVVGVLKDVGTHLTNYIKNNSGNIIETTLGVASSVVSSITNFVIGFIFAIYCLAAKEKLVKQIKKLCNAYLPKKAIKKIYDIANHANKVFSNFVSGQCTEAIIIGILCFIGMLILRIPYASVISVLVGVTALIPVFGAFIGTFIGAFLIFMVNPLKALIFIIFIIVLQQFEGNLIYPRVVGKSVGLPAMWVLVAVTIGASIGGVAGMLLSVPIVSILYSIVATNVNSRLEEKKNKEDKAFAISNKK